MSFFDPQKLIDSAQDGDTIDLKKICQTLGLKLKISTELTDLCRLSIDDKKQPLIELNATLDKKTKFTLVAISAAEFIINAERVQETGVNYDIFFIKEMATTKSTNLMMLATRLAIPEHIIEKIADETEANFSNDSGKEKFDVDAYIRETNYLPEFVRCAIKESSSKFLLDNFS